VTAQEIFADRPSRVESMTGLTGDQVDRLVLDVYARADLDPARRRIVWLYRTVLIVLLYLRHAEHVAERELRSTVRVDGFLAPTGDRRKNTYTCGMYSGKRHACGFNVQVVGSWHGTLVLTGEPHSWIDARRQGVARVRPGRNVRRPATHRRRSRRFSRPNPQLGLSCDSLSSIRISCTHVARATSSRLPRGAFGRGHQRGCYRK